MQRCPRCGNSYCEGHGADFCAACLDPLNSAPSRNVFRVALVGFLGGCVLALWLLVRPPGVPGEGSAVTNNNGNPTATPALTPAGGGAGASGSATPLPSGSTPRPSATGATGTPTATPAPTEAPTEAVTEPPGPLEYTVQEGDTWFGVAEAFGVDATNLAAVNGYTLDDVLNVGVVLVIPQ